MTAKTSPPAPGERVPDASLVSPTGEPSTLHSELYAPATIVYFMRTPTCPVCNAHLRHFGRAIAAGEYGDARVVVIVPGEREDAEVVAAKHASAPLVVRSSRTAHEEFGLFVKAGLQQSGTFVTDADGVVAHAAVATIPVGGYDHAETIAAVRRLAGVEH